jgi:hypothetical protein
MAALPNLAALVPEVGNNFKQCTELLINLAARLNKENKDETEAAVLIQALREFSSNGCVKTLPEETMKLLKEQLGKLANKPSLAATLKIFYERDSLS